MRQRRKELDWSLDQLSFRTRIGARLLGAYERGENKPGTDNLEAIVRAFGDTLPWGPDGDSDESSTARKISFPDWVTESATDDLVPALAGG